MLAHTTGNTGVGLALAVGVLVAGATVAKVKDALTGDRLRVVAGEAVALGNGTARAYLTMNGNEPVELGVALSKEAMKSLPQPQAGAQHEHMPGMTFFPNLLPMPRNNPTQYQMIELDWNPLGHEPEGIYTRPHFDFHFYTVGRDVWESIDPADPRFQEKGTRAPGAEFVPAGYIAPMPLVIPKMGLHWIHPASAELNGKPFTTTFLYGSWDGQFIFAEPMITKTFIESVTDTTIAVPVAQKYQVAGYQPSAYRIRFNEESGEYLIALTRFIKQ